MFIETWLATKINFLRETSFTKKIKLVGQRLVKGSDSFGRWKTKNENSILINDSAKFWYLCIVN